MPLYICRWPNGDASVVMARNKTDAIIQLDEFENAEYSEISRLNEFLVDFSLNDEGRLELAGIGEGTEATIMDVVFPDLEATLMSDELVDMSPDNPEYQRKVREAVEWERKRLWDKRKVKKVREPKTELGKRLKKSTGAASALVDQLVDEMAGELLEDTDVEGPLN